MPASLEGLRDTVDSPPAAILAGLSLKRLPPLEHVGTALVAAITIAVLLTVGVSTALKLAAEDLYTINAELNGSVPPNSRTLLGIWLSAQIAKDAVLSDVSSRTLRADELSYRGDRVREVAGVGALVGLLVAVLSGRPSIGAGRGRDASSPVANTTSNGTA